ncbi:hypothetical protein L1987_15583 [Smallanthus sonchifolius]|uniref:Uncharacterized protein n=1 Tax=Smallanthus sonchifolius TaxID=185202 RepID=A0ACB9J8N1_9ASTR|nr:hypothetical protein L1987_15583 [Smallanthus sonchifolius]
MATILPTMVNQLNQNVAPRNPVCTFKHFNSCNPTKFYGNEGPTVLLQWFESIEGTFINVDCPENQKVRYATSVVQRRALTWWNGEKRNHGIEVALALPWDDVKTRITDEFCPCKEIHDAVLGSKPATLEEAIYLVAALTDNHVKAGTLSKKDAKKTL